MEDVSRTIDVSEHELDEIFGGKDTPTCAQGDTTTCVSSCCGGDIS